jgi:hypothetical protein
MIDRTENMNQCNNINHSHLTCKKALSWSAILAGAFIGMGLSFLLNLFSLAIGLSAFTTAMDGVTHLAIGGFIGLAIGGFIAMYVSGWAAGYLGRSTTARCHIGMLYGLTTWCVTLILTIMLASSMSKFVMYHSNLGSNSSLAMRMSAEDAVVNTTAPAANAETKPVDQATAAANAEKVVNTLGTATFLTFILFFIGAIGSCLGGRHGYCCKKEEMHVTH